MEDGESDIEELSCDESGYSESELEESEESESVKEA